MICNQSTSLPPPPAHPPANEPPDYKIQKKASELFNAIIDPVFDQNRLQNMCSIASKLIEQIVGNKYEIFPFKDQVLQFEVDLDTNDMVFQKIDRQTIKVIISSQRILGKGSYKKVWAAHRLIISLDNPIIAEPIALTKTFGDEDDSEDVALGIELENRFYQESLSSPAHVFWDNTDRYLYTEQERFDANLTQVSYLLTPKDVLPLFSKLCLEIDHLHKKNIVHCDIKNTNIFFRLRNNEPEAHIGDWDLAIDLNKIQDFSVLIANNYAYWDSLRRVRIPLPTTDIFAFVISLSEVILGKPFRDQYWSNPSISLLEKNTDEILKKSLDLYKGGRDKAIVIWTHHLLANILISNSRFFQYTQELCIYNQHEPDFTIHALHAKLLKRYPLYYPKMTSIHKSIEALIG